MAYTDIERLILNGKRDKIFDRLKFLRDSYELVLNLIAFQRKKFAEEDKKYEKYCEELKKELEKELEKKQNEIREDASKTITEKLQNIDKCFDDYMKNIPKEELWAIYYLKRIKSEYIGNEIKTFGEKHKNTLRKAENEHRETVSHHLDYYDEEQLDFTELEEEVNYSRVISIYTSIENSLNGICKHLNIAKKQRGNVKESINEMINGKRIKNIDEKYMFFADGIYAVKNVIAHENGELSDIDDEEKTIITNLVHQGKGLEIDRKIIIKKEFIEYCLEQSEELFNNIFEQICETA